ncbi:ABC transporter permease subunit [Kribbella sp. NPDC050820]|uniref:ABC transporter permease n=1 Tax=Kribbella sp. NPDC050820 TaxID=3155408 RepID=UPI003400AC69
MRDIPVGDATEQVVDWMRENLAAFFDAISAVMLWCVDIILQALTAPHPLVVTAAAAALALWARGIGLAVFTIAGMLLIQGMQLWTQAMESLAVVIVASILAVGVGIPAGIWAARNRAANHFLRPVLDLMQTLPAFVYLIPAVFFFGIGLVPGVVATFIFAIPPAVRLTELGIRQVDKEMVEAAAAFGATPNQTLRQVQLPLAIPSIMAGLNQVIMMSLSMVVIAGLVGAGGLGSVVVTGISRLDIGVGFEGGLAVVFLAMYLDRVTGAFPRERSRRRTRRAPAGTPAPAPEPAADPEPVAAPAKTPA